MLAAPQAGGAEELPHMGLSWSIPKMRMGQGPLSAATTSSMCPKIQARVPLGQAVRSPPTSPLGLDLPIQRWLPGGGGCWHHLALALSHQTTGGGCFLLFNPIFALNSLSLCPPTSSERGIAAGWVQPPEISPSFPHEAPLNSTPVAPPEHGPHLSMELPQGLVSHPGSG